MSAGPAIIFASPSHPGSEMVKVFTAQSKILQVKMVLGLVQSPLPKSQLCNTEPIGDGSRCT